MNGNFADIHFCYVGQSFDLCQKHSSFMQKCVILFCCVRKQPYLCNVKTRQIGIRFNRYLSYKVLSVDCYFKDDACAVRRWRLCLR